MLWRGYISSARRVLPLVEKDRRDLALARITLRTQSPGVDGAINRVSDDLKSDPGLQYERLRWRHRKGRNDDALELLWSVPANQQFPDLWWRERSRQIRYALDDNRKEDAYLLSAAHIQRSGLSFAEAEWNAGWIALRFADKPVEALAAFEKLYNGVSTSISLARAAYWAGRAAEKLDQKKKTPPHSTVSSRRHVSIPTASNSPESPNRPRPSGPPSGARRLRKPPPRSDA